MSDESSGYSTNTLVSAIAPHELGVTTLAPVGDFEAGAYQTFTQNTLRVSAASMTRGHFGYVFVSRLTKATPNSRALLASNARR